MHEEFLLGAGLLLGALALAGVFFLRLRQSAIPAFILLGLVLRPDHLDAELVDSLATAGVVLLLFSMGLEFSLGALVRNARQITRTGGIDLIVCLPVGLVAGLMVGGGWVGALLFAGAFYVSSSAIIAKSIIELRRAADPETEVALGILVFEDLFIALYLAVLAGAVLVSEPRLAEAALRVGRAPRFFGIVVLIALRARPALDRIFDIDSDDLFLLLVGALLLLLSWGALEAGLSEAIGAFLAGLALAETQHPDRPPPPLAPPQGVFAAIFFFAFGLSIDPGTFGSVWLPAVILIVLAGVVKIGGGWIAGRTSGLSKRGSLALGLTLIARGEFSIILAGIAVSVGEVRMGALLALLVLGLSLMGTMGLQYTNSITRWVFPRRAERSLADQGFSPELAGDFPPPPTT
jgi:CPA2 family monovalent cation:H+ antiporter-2